MLAAAAAQHGVLTHAQLVALGLTSEAIKHRIARGKLHPVYRGVFALGRPQLDRSGQQKAALLACATRSALSHSAGLEYWRLGLPQRRLEITVSPPRRVRHPGLRVHQSRTLTAPEIITVDGIAVTDPLRTLIDMAPRWKNGELDDTIERMSQMNLRSPERLLAQLERRASIPGTRLVRDALTRWTLSLTQTQLERRFLPIAKRAGLPEPQRQRHVNGHRVDFFFPQLGLVVEADSLRFHRTAARQTADLRRDQEHVAAGLIPVRYSHVQITYEPDHVERSLRQIAAKRAAST